MIENFDKMKGEIIESVVVQSDSDSGGTHYCEYRIIIKTNKNEITFHGWHDYTPDTIIIPKEQPQQKII